jgi:hypothetical protein
MVFWVVTSCSVVGCCQGFQGILPYFLHLQGRNVMPFKFILSQCCWIGSLIYSYFSVLSMAEAL